MNALIIQQIQSQMEHACLCVAKGEKGMAKAAFLECAVLTDLLDSDPPPKKEDTQLTIDIP